VVKTTHGVGSLSPKAYVLGSAGLIEAWLTLDLEIDVTPLKRLFEGQTRLEVGEMEEVAPTVLRLDESETPVRKPASDLAGE
jgi:hypothetical protein